MPSDAEATGPKDEVLSAPSSAGAPSEEGEMRSDDGSDEPEPDKSGGGTERPLLDPEATTGTPSDAPPLPDEPVPGSEPTDDRAVDDGWSAEWDATRHAWYFYNRFTGLSQWDNPRVPGAAAGKSSAAGSASAAAAVTVTVTATVTATATATRSPPPPTSVAGGYNPAIHGSWDPNAPYAQAYKSADVVDEELSVAPLSADTMVETDPYTQAAAFNSRTGKPQSDDQNPERYSDAAKSHRQMNAYFDVDRAANSHDGRSLKAERRGKQPTKQELAMWKEKRKARKEEKRRAWLRD